MTVYILKTVVLVSCLALVTGCGTSMFVQPIKNPIIEDKVGYASFFSDKEQLGTLATTAQRRIVLVKLKGENIGKFCAEPSPDATDNLASTLSMILEAKLDKPNGSVGGEAGFESALATTVEKMGVRSQGVQFFRDGMYSLCQSFLNGAVNAEDFQEIHHKLMDLSASLIETELKYKDSLISAPAAQIKAPEQLIKSQQQQQLESLKNRGITQAEKDKQATASFTAKATLETSRANAELAKARAENSLLAEKRKAELDKLTADGAIQAEKDKAEIALKQARIDKAKKDQELGSLLNNEADSP